MGRGAAPFEHFLARGDPGREWGRMLVLHFQDAGEYTLCTMGGKYYGSVS